MALGGMDEEFDKSEAGIFDSLFGEGSKAYKQGFNFGVTSGTDEGNKFANQALSFYNTALAPFYDVAKEESDRLFTAAQGTHKDILGSIGEGFNNARANVTEQGRLAMQGARDAQTQALGASQQAAINSGLSGSSAHAAQNRSIASDAARNIGNLSAGIGQLLSSLDIGEAQAEASAGGALSGALQNQAGAAQNFLGLQYSGINQSAIEAPEQDGLTSILGPLLGAAGAFFGG